MDGTPNRDPARRAHGRGLDRITVHLPEWSVPLGQVTAVIITLVVEEVLREGHHRILSFVAAIVGAVIAGVRPRCRPPDSEALGTHLVTRSVLPAVTEELVVVPCPGCGVEVRGYPDTRIRELREVHIRVAPHRCLRVDGDDHAEGA